MYILDMYLLYGKFVLVFLEYIFSEYMHGILILLGGNSKIGAHVWSNLCHLISLRHLIISRAVTNRIFFRRKVLFAFFAQRVLNNQLTIYISTMTVE